MAADMSFTKIHLVGAPNSGKSSLFNQLTGLNQKVGNYGGVTVEVKTGKFGKIEVVDLPGLRSMHSGNPDEQITRKFLLDTSNSNEAFIYVANGSLLEESLMLFSEIADLQKPILFVVNFKDELEKNKIVVDRAKFERLLGCPVILINSISGEGIVELQNHLTEGKFLIPNAFCRSTFDTFSEGVYQNGYLKHLIKPTSHNARELDFQKRKKIISLFMKTAVQKEENTPLVDLSRKWDKVLIHPVFGVLIFLSVMYLTFQAVFAVSSYPMDWIDGGFSAVSQWIHGFEVANWLKSLLADAIVPGIAGVLIFIPQIAILFLLLGILEHTGYLSRISLISDSFLKRFGLSGKSIIPLMSNWACAIPAIMSTRMLSNPRERMALIFASPLMTCSARLPVYAILISVLIPYDDSKFFGAQGLALLALYLLGVAATLIIAWIFTRRTSVQENAFWSMELPVYRWPNWRSIFINVYQKTKSFIIEAGKIIFAISILLWVLSTNSPKGSDFIDQQHAEIVAKGGHYASVSHESIAMEYSYMGYIGKFIEPAIKPLGYDWKIGIALITSFAAREVFVGTLSTIYSIESEEDKTIVEKLKAEVNRGTGEPRFGLATVISLLLFYVFALQCMSTLAIVRKETGSWRYAIYQFLLFFAMAYISALAAFQILG